MSNFTREQVLALLAQQREACATSAVAHLKRDGFGGLMRETMRTHLRATPLVALPEHTSHEFGRDCQRCIAETREALRLEAAKPTEPSITVERNPWLLCCADYPHCACRRGPP